MSPSVESSSEPPVMQRVVLSAAYFWLVMVTYYILKPVRDSLFLGERGHSELPIAHLANLFTTLFCVSIYTRLAQVLSRRQLVMAVNGFCLLSILVFWSLLGPVGISASQRAALAWVYFVWVSTFAVFGVTLLWSLNHTTFRPEEGKLYYGWIGSGGTLGAFCGGFLTRKYAVSLGTDNLLLLAAGTFTPLLVLGYILGGRADRRAAALAVASPEPAGQKKLPEESGGEEAAREVAAPHSAAPRSPLAMLRANPYLMMIAGLVFLKLFVALTKDYQLQKIIADSFLNDRDGRTEFFGKVYQWTNVLGLGLGLFVTGPVQSRWGALPGLMTYPLTALATAVGLSLWPNLTMVLWMAVISQACAYSIFQWSQELLYQRTSKEEKFVAKGFIDTFVFRLGTGSAALFILVANAAGTRGMVDASQVVMGCLAFFSLLLLGLCFYLGMRFNELGATSEG